MARTISILGSTGSIGSQTLDVIRAAPEHFRVGALVARNSAEALAHQVREFRPAVAGCVDEHAYRSLVTHLSDYRANHAIELVCGTEALEAAAALHGCDVVVSAVVGAVGVRAALAAIRHGKTLALANKETLVAAGQLIMEAAEQSGRPILPIDSEHSAVFQCLEGRGRGALRKVVLTASGGPFRTLDGPAMAAVTPEMALRHPNWAMGPKITIDCATMMNKGLEVIEAHWLFGADYGQIDVVVHPESAIHSMVELVDGSIIAQMGVADMRLPIQYALAYPDRIGAVSERLDLVSLGRLSFEAPDLARFPCLALAYAAGRYGAFLPAVVSAANEVAVSAFLSRDIGFTEIHAMAARVADESLAAGLGSSTLEAIEEADFWARSRAYDIVRLGA